MNAIYQTSDGQLVSVGTVVASPLPAGLAVQPLSDADADGLADGSRTWDPATRAVVPTPGWVDPAIAEGNKTAIETNLEQDQAAMQAIIDTPNVSFTTVAQSQTAMRDIQRQLKDAARNLKRLNRVALGDYDGTT